ncbi:MAG: hypothetical protein JW822_05215 [Spirochaetales bacterium]|nr:hypothetical protein [Spirochaetales bacterium]
MAKVTCSPQSAPNILPQHGFLIIISRNDLTFKVSDLRLQDLILKIRVQELRLNSTEITHLLKDYLQMKLPPQNRLLLHNKAADWFEAK